MVVEVESAQPEGSPDDRHPRRTGRWVVAGTVLALGVLLTPVAAVAIWLQALVLDTDAYVATVAPLADDPAIQSAVTHAVSERIVEAADLETRVQRVLDALLPSNVRADASVLATPLTERLDAAAHRAVGRVVESPRFAAAWEGANRTAHEQAVAVLTGDDGGTLVTDDTTISVELGPFVDTARDQLVDEGFPLAERIPEVDARVVLVQSDQLPRIQRAVRLMEVATGTLLALVIVLLVVAFAVAPGRRRLAVIAGVAMTAVLGGILVLLVLARTGYLTALDDRGRDAAAGAAVWDAFLEPMSDWLARACAIALLVALGAWLAAPTGPSAALRRVTVAAVGRLRDAAARAGWRRGPVGRRIDDHVDAVRAVVIAAGVVAVIALTSPTVGDVVRIALGLLAALLLVEFLRRDTPPRAESDVDQDPEPAVLVAGP